MADTNFNSSAASSSASGSMEQLSVQIMVAAIVALFMVIIFVLFLHLYARRFWRRHSGSGVETHPAITSHFVSAPTQQEQLELSLLPVLIFHPDDFQEQLECAVCLCQLQDGDKIRLLPKCNHGFHVDCIDMWFQSHITCPLCRSIVSDSTTTTNTTSAGYDQYSDSNIIESPNLPTNQTLVSTGSIEEEATTSNSVASNLQDAALVIEIPRLRQITDDGFTSPASRVPEEEMKSPMITRLRRLLSREKRVIIIPSSSGFVDIEHGVGMSSKTS